jgi:hypothetical protein
MSRAARTPTAPGPGYDEDFFAWTQHTAALLRSGRFAEIDVAHLAEEVEDMGRRDRRAVEGRLQVLLAHLLKWSYQPHRRSSSWRTTVRTQRSRIALVLGDSPSLSAQVPAIVIRSYPKAVALAADETGLPADRFPERCPYSAEQILDEEFLPE